jgi:molybdopterin molybdotransferase
MRDVNRHTLQALIVECHATPVWLGIAPDSERDIARMVEDGLNRTDLVLISGGSSMGTRDLVIEVLEKRFGADILLHGVSVSPGKPLIAAQVGSKPVFGLPGHPISAMVSFQQFVEPLLRRLEGEDTMEPYLRTVISARLARNIPSQEGRTDFVRVRLQKKEGKLLAMPVPGKSGMISGMVRSDGFIRIREDSEGLYKGDRVAVHLFSHWIEESLEKEYLPGHEGAEGCAAGLFEACRQERLSGI